jgi:hypothetical protein
MNVVALSHILMVLFFGILPDVPLPLSPSFVYLSHPLPYVIPWFPNTMWHPLPAVCVDTFCERQKEPVSVRLTVREQGLRSCPGCPVMWNDLHNSDCIQKTYKTSRVRCYRHIAKFLLRKQWLVESSFVVCFFLFLPNSKLLLLRYCFSLLLGHPSTSGEHWVQHKNQRRKQRYPLSVGEIE